MLVRNRGAPRYKGPGSIGPGRGHLPAQAMASAEPRND